jgi:general secretion pathway protein L
LFVRLSESGMATWGAFDATGRLVGRLGRGPLIDVQPALGNRRCTVLVSSTDVLTSQAELPVASQTRLRQIVPFSLEESLADDVESMVFSIGARLPSGATQVAAVAKERIDAWLLQLQAAGIVPSALCSEIDGVPDIPATLVLVIEGGRIAGRKPGQPPFALEGLELGQALDLVLSPKAGEDELKHIQVFVDEAARVVFAPELARLNERFASADVKLVSDVFPRLAATLAQRPGTNLLQGAYAPKSNWAALARPWRLAASLLAASIALVLLLSGAEYWQLRRTDAELTALLTTLCQRVVGDSTTSGCQREVRQRLGASTGTTNESFLTTLAAVATARDADTRVDALSYRNRALDLQLIAPNVPTLDEFSRELEQTRRFDVAIEATNQGDEGTEGRVRIVGVAP